jgi:tetratricopeptide (TPR) repeat protein
MLDRRDAPPSAPRSSARRWRRWPTGPLAALLLAAPPTLDAQGAPAGDAPGNPRAAAMREASRLDTEGRTKEARALFQRMIDSAADPAAKAAAQRSMAMSYAFDGDCANTVKYERQVIDYWKTREQAEPQNAFYQQGEMANEAARVCIDVGNLDEAERLYVMGRELGLEEPEPRTHPKSLWDYRTEHALARLAARRGKKDEAMKHVAAARALLDADSAMARQQERFFPYLTGYVALYTNDLATAAADLSKAIAMPGNQSDPFMHYLLATTHERMGHPDQAKPLYQKAYDLATGHNPPAAFVRPNARKKLP